MKYEQHFAGMPRPKATLKPARIRISAGTNEKKTSSGTVKLPEKNKSGATIKNTTCQVVALFMILLLKPIWLKFLLLFVLLAESDSVGATANP